MTSSIFHGWALEFERGPLDGYLRYLAGVRLGFPPYVHDEGHPCRALVFSTRREARERLREHKARSAWAFTGEWADRGGDRIYKTARVVPVTITVEVAE